MAEANSTPTHKACRKCGVEKPLHPDHFSPQKAGKYGFTSRCRDCRNAQEAERRERPDAKARQQAWRDANKDYTHRYNKAYRAAGYKSTWDVKRWREKNLEKVRARGREKQRRLVAANPQKYRDIARRSAAKHRDRILQRARERSELLYRTEPWFNLKVKVASRVRRMLLGAAGGKSRARTEALLGYSMQELAEHIERQFSNGMSWEKVFSGEVEIDHIVPVRVFKVSSLDDPELRACWALTNLRPMWKSKNRAKGAKVLTLL